MQLALANRELQLERTATVELIVMPQLKVNFGCGNDREIMVLFSIIQLSTSQWKHSLS
ncbi:MAG: hypothetical protein NZ660_14165 [Oscillatoriaceae bacterium SKYG93]|nr:hypothetical protein [Oscillatoriaceae bacterium SKYG93]MDW8454586.1 hypothetical protein [Oscillatoriaceae cyanobacterium SKYGB_i_bin93]